LHGVYLIEEKEKVYGFLDPAYTNPVEPRSYETQAYITNTLEKEGKNLFMPLY